MKSAPATACAGSSVTVMRAPVRPAMSSASWTTSSGRWSSAGSEADVAAHQRTGDQRGAAHGEPAVATERVGDPVIRLAAGGLGRGVWRDADLLFATAAAPAREISCQLPGRNPRWPCLTCKAQTGSGAGTAAAGDLRRPADRRHHPSGRWSGTNNPMPSGRVALHPGFRPWCSTYRESAPGPGAAQEVRERYRC